MHKRAKKQGMIRLEGLHLAIDQLYSAILTGDSCLEALDALANHLNAAGCVFYQRGGGANLLQLPVPESLRSYVAEYVQGGWYSNDPRAERGWPLVDSGRSVVLEQEIASNEEREKLPIYQELLRDHGLLWWAAIAFKSGGQNWCLSIPRLAEQGAFTVEDARGLAVLAPRLAQLISLAQKFSDTRTLGAIDTLTRLSAPAFVLDGSGRCTRFNIHAERLLDHDFYISRGRLRAGDRNSDARLQILLAAACVPSLGAPQSKTLEPVAIVRPGRRPLAVEVLSSSASVADVFSNAIALVTATEMTGRSEPSEKLLRELFALAPAEARLTAFLARGATLEEAAEALGITRETARTRLKAIFAKTGTNRQAELAALLARSWRVFAG